MAVFTQVLKYVETIYQYPFPEGYKDVIDGIGYWYPNLVIVGEPGLCYYKSDYEFWTKYDPKHPKCYYCGKFVKAGNWWKYTYRKRTGPCMNCDEEDFSW